MSIAKWLLARKLGGGSPLPPVIKRKTGNPITITDAAAAPMVKCVTQITGSQDLHGYDKPWVGGAGKNKYSVLVGSDTWSNNSATHTNDNGTLVISIGANLSTPGVYASNNVFVNTYKNKSTKIVVSFYAWATTANGFYCGNGGYPKAINVTTTKQRFTYTMDANSAFTWVFYQQNDNKIANTLYISDVQIEEGETASPYEPYSNICPITAYTEGEIEVRGHMIWDEQWELGSLNTSTGEKTASNYIIRSKNYIPVFPSTQYFVGYTESEHITRNIVMCFYDENKTFLSSITSRDVITTPENAKFMLFRAVTQYGTTYHGYIAINTPSTFTEYVTYKGTTHTTTFPSAIYRGSEDVVEGEVIRAWAIIDLGDRTWTKAGVRFYTTWTASNAEKPYANATETGDYLTNAICTQYHANTRNAIERDNFAFSIHNSSAVYLTVVDSRYSTVEDFTAAMSGVMVAYPLATPSTSSVTPTNIPIKSLSGYTHIESSTGDMVVDYITDAYQNFVDTVESALPNTTRNLLSASKGGTKAMDIFLSLEKRDDKEEEVKEETKEDTK